MTYNAVLAMSLSMVETITDGGSDENAWKKSGNQLITSISAWLIYSANPYPDDGSPSITG
jgi:hypothetical protein